MSTHRIPSLKALRALEATARHRSLTKAADELNVTTAAISQQLKTLEHDFKTKLIRRHDGELRMADLAEVGLADLREGFERILSGVRKMREFGSERPLIISVEPSLAATWLLKRLPQFNSEHPNIDVRLDASLRVIDLARERDIDMGIRYSDGEYPGHRADKLFGEEFFPVCSPRLLTGDHPIRTPKDLHWHTLLHDDSSVGTADASLPTWEGWLRAWECSVDPKAGPHFPQTSMVVEAAVLGHGVALTGGVIASERLVAGELVRPFGPSVTTTTDFGYYLVCLEEIADRLDVVTFREWALRQAKLA